MPCLPCLPNGIMFGLLFHRGETRIFFCFTGIAPADGTGVSQKPKNKRIISWACP